MPAGMTGRQRIIGFMLCIATILPAVLDTDIVSSATVPIVHDLDPAHDADKISWPIAACRLAATAALPLYGNLCDALGTKKVFIGAVATFLSGPALRGLAGSMGELIAARAGGGPGPSPARTAEGECLPIHRNTAAPPAERNSANCPHPHPDGPSAGNTHPARRNSRSSGSAEPTERGRPRP